MAGRGRLDFFAAPRWLRVSVIIVYGFPVIVNKKTVKISKNLRFYLRVPGYNKEKPTLEA